MGATAVRALNQVSIDIKRGDFNCILGPSGSGKSTLLNMIGGLDRPTTGEVLVENEDITEMDELSLAGYRKNKIGFIFQSYNLLANLTALENVEMPLIFNKIPRTKRLSLASQALKQVGLEHRLNHKPAELSGGEQQRVSIARALINQPAVILADEPTGNLDSKTSQEIMALLKETNRKNNQTFIMVTHNQELIQYADLVIYMRDGVIEKEERKT